MAQYSAVVDDKDTPVSLSSCLPGKMWII